MSQTLFYLTRQGIAQLQISSHFAVAGQASVDGRRCHGDADRSIVGGRKGREENEFCLSIENVLQGIDRRTTLMIRHIPNKYSQTAVLDEICQESQEDYDFFYLPIGNKIQINLFV